MDTLSGLTGAILAVVALMLALKDHSQQEQINTLTTIADKITKQNTIDSEQNAQLIQIAESSNSEDSLSNLMLRNLSKQAVLSNQQLRLSRKADSTTNLQLAIQAQTDLFDLRKSFDHLLDVNKTLSGLYNLPSMSYADRNRTLDDLRNELDAGLKNTLILTDKNLSVPWLSYYTQFRTEEFFLKSYTGPAPNGNYKDTAQFNQACRDLMTNHMLFINQILKVLNSLEQQYLIQITAALNDSLYSKKLSSKKIK